MNERAITTLLRSAPLAATVIAVVWVGAIGFRAAWWTTGRIDAGWNALTWSVGTAPLESAAQIMAAVGTGVPALVEIALLVVLVQLRRGTFWAISTALICEVSSLQVQAMKAVAGRARPDSAYGWSTSFPSGHTALAALLMTLAALLVLHGRWRLLAVPYPVIMGWSRTQLHAHWLSDVLAGALLGAATAVLLVLLAGLVKPQLSLAIVRERERRIARRTSRAGIRSRVPYGAVPSASPVG